ncbi:response regulator transcription factor [Burkholderia ubonensis]|uniref:LuxR family transcriptional regulator n=1 Tax=Burkholderia ubonensis TaxID=101571 RepID=A0AAW3MQ97_9BURK|nr:response regulator transcription factor [Burkholderia ubonensis]KVK98973.1 hypothetical protein WJ45_15970 [Burkholderia ubonensis]KVN83141.1 hypothetical protein WJ67_04560 [Burkholderia ubonensis]KVO39542.1 hypothetical protein WJ75_08525 [Burkholderia ubonensis]KVP89356.1 hypothetical protein WJ96_20395 [Burkholderia ubonensis]KVQ54169.1 hypothetical protein WK04_02715 [Burkholderia ubonensis]
MASIGREQPPVINLIVADEHPVVVMGILKTLEGTDDIRVVATAADVEGLLSALANHSCDVLVCEFGFSHDGARDGLRLMERLIQQFPALKIILLTVYEDLALVRHVVTIGVAGFIGKSSETLDALPMAIRAVKAGGTYLDPAITRTLANRLLQESRRGDTGRHQTLTRREFEVVRQLVKGMSVSEIARETNRSVKTVSTQKIRAMGKLGARNDVELGTRFRNLAGEEKG